MESNTGAREKTIRQSAGGHFALCLKCNRFATEPKLAFDLQLGHVGAPILASPKLLVWIGGLVVEEGFPMYPLQEAEVQIPNHQSKPPMRR